MESEYAIGIEQVATIFGEEMFDAGFKALGRSGIEPADLVEVMPLFARYNPETDMLVFNLRIKHDSAESTSDDAATQRYRFAGDTEVYYMDLNGAGDPVHCTCPGYNYRGQCKHTVAPGYWLAGAELI